MSHPIRVTVWNEYRHEKKNPKVTELYPDGMHATIAKFLNADPGINAKTATLDEPEHGLTDEVLENTDVLIWWGHMAHGDVDDEIVKKVHTRVLEGMGFIALHSAHYAKPFKALMGTTCSLIWREASDKERLWNLVPSHPITKGIGEFIEIPMEEMYGEPFGIPTPDELIFISWFTGGEVFRSGATWRRGNGNIFYFRPGHETYPSYHHEDVQTVITNAVHWAYSGIRIPDSCENRDPLEPLPEDPDSEVRSSIGFK